MKNAKKIIDLLKKFLLILIIGGFGGVLAVKFIMPYLITLPTFSDIEALKNSIDETTIINKTENITISEEEGVEKALSKVDVSLAGVRAYKGKVLLREGCGVVITGDGYVISSKEMLANNADKIDVILGDDTIAADIVDQENDLNILVLKIDKKDLTPISFVDFEDLKIAQKLILAGLDLEEKTKFVNITNIRSIYGENIKLNLASEDISANGAPFVNLKGQLVGISFVDVQTNVLTLIPISAINKLSFKNK